MVTGKPSQGPTHQVSLYLPVKYLCFYRQVVVQQLSAALCSSLLTYIYKVEKERNRGEISRATLYTAPNAGELELKLRSLNFPNENLLENLQFVKYDKERDRVGRGRTRE